MHALATTFLSSPIKTHHVNLAQRWHQLRYFPNNNLSRLADGPMTEKVETSQATPDFFDRVVNTEEIDTEAVEKVTAPTP
jgi:hypothetical protein